MQFPFRISSTYKSIVAYSHIIPSVCIDCAAGSFFVCVSKSKVYSRTKAEPKSNEKTIFLTPPPLSFSFPCLTSQTNEKHVEHSNKSVWVRFSVAKLGNSIHEDLKSASRLRYKKLLRESVISKYWLVYFTCS